MKWLFVLIVCFFCKESLCQSLPNLANSAVLSPTAENASKLSAVPVNIFTGIPQIGVPIYSYSNASSGLSLGVSLNYFAGGTQVAESPSTAGLGWYLSAGGVVTRTVRGAPDDLPVTGYMNAAAIPTDFRADGSKYYFDSLDTQQDIFQFNFNGQAGQFYIGKNKQVVIVPASKLKVIPITGGTGIDNRIISFRIITPDGIKYDFSNAVGTSITTNGADPSLFRSAYAGQYYNSAWYLSTIISAFSKDTITFNYSLKSLSSDFAYPQVIFNRNSDGVTTKTYTPIGKSITAEYKVSSIVFPEKTTLSILYDGYGISKIKVSDTAFRYGYLFTYLNYSYPVRSMLQSITPYTAKEKKDGYYFIYNLPYFAQSGSLQDTIQNKRDFWGFYNGAYNPTTLIPKINGYPLGANRNPDSSFAIANSLNAYSLPGGGFIKYEYELNDHLPYIKDPQKITVAPATGYQNTITLSQVFKTKHQLLFTFDSSILRNGTVPITGTGNVTVNIKSTDGLTTYNIYTLSLYNLFYQGIQSWLFNVPNGNYQLQILPPAGTTITGSFPVNVSWENKLTDNTKTAVKSGGLRIKRITRQNMIDDPTGMVQEFRYINPDGTSSGFLGDIPKYDYPYQETVNFGGSTTTSYTAISSEPVNNLDYTQGSPVGYSRVEVINGRASHNIGKTVYEFTAPQDVNATIVTASFPYAPQDLRDWGIGLPKKVSVYDSLGGLVKKTVNNYAFDTTLFINSNFKSIKLGNSFTYYNGDPNLAATPKARTFVGQEYYPLTGWAYVTASYDTLFQANGSLNTSYTNFTYDTNYNVTKVVSGYDRNRNLQIEKRFYYPYNYTLAGPIGKLRDSGIITPVIATENWITGDANPRIAAGTITDFQQLTNGIIKPLTLYNLQVNKPVPQTIIGTFNTAVLNRNSTYFVPQTSFINYDSKGNLLQSQNVQSGVSSSVIIDYPQQYTVAKVSNAVNTDIAYTSFEASGTGNFTIAGAVRDSLNAITGKKSYNLSNGNITKTGLSALQYYLVTVWAKTGAAVSVNAVALSGAVATQNNWNLFTTTLTGITAITISGSGLIDELRLHPKNAGMVTSTYEPLVGVTSMADANNTIMYNEYDNLNRLKLVRDKDKNILKRYDYSDSAMAINIAPVWSITVACNDGTNGQIDTTKTDINPLSDSYNTAVVTTGSNFCTCSTTALHPDFKIVNGTCEQGGQCVTSSVYVKIVNPDGSFYFTWKCTFHYQWSDNSISGNYIRYNSSTCPLGCSGEP